MFKQVIDLPQVNKYKLQIKFLHPIYHSFLMSLPVIKQSFLLKGFFLMKKVKKICLFKIIDISLHRKNAMAR